MDVEEEQGGPTKVPQRGRGQEETVRSEPAFHEVAQLVHIEGGRFFRAHAAVDGKRSCPGRTRATGGGRLSATAALLGEPRG